MIQKAGVAMGEISFLVQGCFGLFNPLADKDPRKPMPPFLMIGSGKTYGDYQLLFDLYPKMDFKTYNPGET